MKDLRSREYEAQLLPDGDHTVLVLEEHGLPLREIAAHGAGWQVHVEDLAAHLTGREQADWRERWAEVNPSYLAQAQRRG